VSHFFVLLKIQQYFKIQHSTLG